MNERIQELKHLAWLWCDENIPEQFDITLTIGYGEHWENKFAELIVKECVGVVEGGSFLHDQAPTAIFARECSGAIKRHFGVEE